TYTDDGFSSSVTDPLGHTTTTYADGMGRTDHIDNPIGTTGYQYFGKTSSGSYSTVEYDQLHRETVRTYDALGQLISVDLPAITIDDPQNPGNSIQVNPHYEYTYDEHGNQITQITNAFRKDDGTIIYLKKNTSGQDVVTSAPQIVDGVLIYDGEI